MPEASCMDVLVSLQGQRTGKPRRAKSTRYAAWLAFHLTSIKLWTVWRPCWRPLLAAHFNRKKRMRSTTSQNQHHGTDTVQCRAEDA